MFGGTCHLINGNMMCGVYKDYLILRLNTRFQGTSRRRRSRTNIGELSKVGFNPTASVHKPWCRGCRPLQIDGFFFYVGVFCVFTAAATIIAATIKIKLLLFQRTNLPDRPHGPCFEIPKYCSSTSRDSGHPQILLLRIDDFRYAILPTVDKDL